MAKIYTSYKYKDAGVRPLPGISGTTARQYVDLLQFYLDTHEHTNKGEEEGEDLSNLSEDRIRELLYNRIYDSTITIVLISKNMRENKLEKDQWIPREISYSLSEHSRGGRTSHTNAVLAVVIPDENNSYEHFIKENTCSSCNSIILMTGSVFKIIGDNMFNHNNKDKTECINCVSYWGDHSYICAVKWGDFINNVDRYLGCAIRANENISDYDIKKEIV
ncbi:MAG: TIR domain-containing protein [Promethearchaeota archaeon]